MIQVEVVYVAEDKTTTHLTLSLKKGASVADALIESGLYDSHPETKDRPVGIYSKQVELTTCLKDGDRVELYRPLLRDPKEKRRQQTVIKPRKVKRNWRS